MAAARLAALPRQPPHRSTAPTSLAVPLAHNGPRFSRRERAERAKRSAGTPPGWRGQPSNQMKQIFVAS